MSVAEIVTVSSLSNPNELASRSSKVVVPSPNDHEEISGWNTLFLFHCCPKKTVFSKATNVPVNVVVESARSVMSELKPTLRTSGSTASAASSST